jgi:hypothetical protein
MLLESLWWCTLVHLDLDVLQDRLEDKFFFLEAILHINSGHEVSPVPSS